MLCRLLLLLAVTAAATALHPWTMVPVADRQWLATWPGVHGVILMTADNTSTVANRVHAERVLGGHDRMTGLAVWEDTEFGTGDLLLYVNSFDDHRVWRYQVTPDTWEVRGQLQVLSPERPHGLALDVTGDKMCVSGDTSLGRVVKCYRIQRALADNGVDLNEWWVLVSNFQWTADSGPGEGPRAEAVLYDERALPTDASVSGSLWVDTKQARRPLVRFPVASITGAFMPSFTELPADISSERLTWTDTPTTQLLLSAQSAYRLQWTKLGGAPLVLPAEPLHRTTDAADYLRGTLWRQTSLDVFQRLDLDDGGTVVVEFNRLADAIAVGEVAASPSQTPSQSPTPSETSTASPSATPGATPLPSATLPPTPKPSLLPEIVVLPDEKEAAQKHHGGTSNERLWALTTLIVPFCCVPLAVVVAWRNRRGIARAVRQPRAALRWPKRSDSLQPYSVTGQGGEEGIAAGWTRLYDDREATAIALPLARDNSDFGDGQFVRS